MTISSQIQAVVVAWQIYDITHDPLSLGLMGLAEALPVHRDRAVRRPRRRSAQSAPRRRSRRSRCCSRCSLALLAYNLIPGFLGDARRAAVLRRDLRERHRAQLRAARPTGARRRVDRSVDLCERASRGEARRGSSRRSSARHSADLIYGFASPRVAYVADAIMMAVALVSFWSIDYAATRAGRDATSRLARVSSSGLRFVFRESVLLSALTLDLFSVLLGGAEALLAGVRRSDSARRPAGTRHSARGAGGGRGRGVGVSGASSAVQARGSNDALRRGDVRAVHHRVRTVAKLHALGGRCWRSAGWPTT